MGGASCKMKRPLHLHLNSVIRSRKIKKAAFGRQNVFKRKGGLEL